MLQDQYKRADNDPGGAGDHTLADAWAIVDESNPPIGETFKISGIIYILSKELTFEEV